VWLFKRMTDIGFKTIGRCGFSPQVSQNGRHVSEPTMHDSVVNLNVTPSNWPVHLCGHHWRTLHTRAHLLNNMATMT